MSYEKIEEKPVSLFEVEKHLKDIKKRDEELNFRGNKTEEYIQSVLQLNKTQSEKLKKQLEDLQIPRLKEEHIAKIVDLLPTTQDQLKNILHGYTITVNKENLNKIVSTIKEFK